MTISSRSSLSLSAVVAVLLAALLGAGMVATAPAAGASAGTFTSLLNSERGSGGLAPLSSNGDLAAVASRWAASMASSDQLAHNPQLTSQVSGWRFVGENVGYGPDAATIHRALMDSPSHRANILDTQYTQVGIGVAQVGGRVWVAQVFRTPSGASAKPKPAPKAKPAPAPTAVPPPSPDELLRERADAAASGPGAEAVTDPVQQSLRFVEVMRAVHG